MHWRHSHICRLFIACFAVSCLTGCLHGSRPLSEMTTQDIHARLRAGKTSMEDVRHAFREPQEQGIERGHVLWFYWYQKVSGVFFIPVANIFSRDANTRGYLRVTFDDNRFVKEVDYHGSR